MNTYKFRLQTVLRLRVAARDQKRGALADAFRAEQVLAERRAELAEEQRVLRGVQLAARSGRYLDANRLLEAQRYELVLKALEQELTQQERLLAAEVQKRQHALVEADREVRALDLLDERQRREHRRRQLRLETKQLDEAALTARLFHET